MVVFLEIVFVYQEKAKALLVVPVEGQFPDVKDRFSLLHKEDKIHWSKGKMIEFWFII